MASSGPDILSEPPHSPMAEASSSSSTMTTPTRVQMMRMTVAHRLLRKDAVQNIKNATSSPPVSPERAESPVPGPESADFGREFSDLFSPPSVIVLSPSYFGSGQSKVRVDACTTPPPDDGPGSRSAEGDSGDGARRNPRVSPAKIPTHFELAESDKVFTVELLGAKKEREVEHACDRSRLQQGRTGEENEHTPAWVYSDDADDLNGREGCKSMDPSILRTLRQEAKSDLLSRIEDWKSHDPSTFGGLVLEDVALSVFHDSKWRSARVSLFERIILVSWPRERSKVVSHGNAKGSIEENKKSLKLKGRVGVRHIVEINRRISSKPPDPLSPGPNRSRAHERTGELHSSSPGTFPPSRPNNLGEEMCRHTLEILWKGADRTIGRRQPEGIGSLSDQGGVRAGNDLNSFLIRFWTEEQMHHWEKVLWGLVAREKELVELSEKMRSEPRTPPTSSSS